MDPTRHDIFTEEPQRPILRRTPWLGISAVAGMLSLVTASGIILTVSHDDAVASWAIQPAVLLAIFSAASNLIFNSALATAIAVRFWASASRGVKLSQLHYIWDHARLLNLFSALRAGPPASNVVLFALLANVMQFLSGPLLQRATYQTLQARSTDDVLRLDLSSRIPEGWFGLADQGMIVNFDRGLPLIQQWWLKTPMTTTHSCPGTCTGVVPGAGFTYNCWTTQTQLAMADESTNNQTVFLIATSPSVNGTNEPGYLRVELTHVSSVDKDCLGTITHETCDVVPATVEYPVTVQNNTVSLSLKGHPKVLSTYTYDGDSPLADTGAPSGALAALATFALTRITDNATKRYSPLTDTTTYRGPGVSADLFYDQDKAVPERCQVKWTDPKEYAMGSLYEFMFRAALLVGNGSETQILSVNKTVPTLVFRTDTGYLGGGIASMIVGLVMISGLMWGWWQLERPVTLSPLETAGALGAPILREAGAPLQRTATIEEILRRVRNVEFKVGEARVEVVEVVEEKGFKQ
ncbi:hypothetical protein OQA88_4431 [Cercophora sp. LCS_1]